MLVRSLKSVVKKITPLTLRVHLKKMGYRYLDFVKPVVAPRVPSRAGTFVGGGDFVAIGDHFLNTLKRHTLQPTDNVMDVGCGQGRMARPLVDYLTTGQYVGLDISKDSIEWCQSQYADVAGFQFISMDVFNSRYNPDGAQQASDYVFPIADASQDMVFLTSVFTHMLASDIERYLQEIARVLKTGKQVLITWYILDNISREAKSPGLNFKYEFDRVSRTTLKSTPEAAIAFDSDFIRHAYKRAGLEITIIEYGSWARPNRPFMFQDIIVAKKI